jgi:hypothetical protein
MRAKTISLNAKEWELFNMAFDDLIEKAKQHRRITGDDEFLIDAVSITEKLRRKFVDIA